MNDDQQQPKPTESQDVNTVNSSGSDPNVPEASPQAPSQDAAQWSPVPESAPQPAPVTTVPPVQPQPVPSPAPMQPPAPTGMASHNPGQTMGIVSIILGVLTLWLIGLPLAIVSMVKSKKANASRTLGIIGRFLS